MAYTLFCPAKINLFLKILKKRDDGYHDIDSVFAKLNFGDQLTFEDKKEGIEILAKGDFKVPTNSDNLVFKAADLMRSRAKGKRGIRITINKKIPIGGGMGGGSSNAATVLTFLNKYWDVNLPLEELLQMGKTLGADVPFFLYPETFARVSGIGEIIHPIQDLKILPFEISEQSKIVLVIPNKITVPSAWAYQQIQKFFPGGVYPQDEKNTFEPAIFDVYPDLKNIKQTLFDLGAEYALMTGSGSVVFGIFEKSSELRVQNLEEKGKVVECGFL